MPIRMQLREAGRHSRTNASTKPGTKRGSPIHGRNVNNHYRNVTTTGPYGGTISTTHGYCNRRKHNAGPTTDTNGHKHAKHPDIRTDDHAH